MSLWAIPGLLKETGFAWLEDRGPRLGAALAFYMLFSLAPLLIIVIAVAALAFGQEVAHAQIMQQIEVAIGADGAGTIQSVIENASRPSSGISATLIGLATLLFGATIVFSEIQDALNTIWKVPPKPERSMVIGLLRERFFAFVMVLGIGLLLLLAILGNIVLGAVVEILGDILPAQAMMLRAANLLLFLGVLTLLFAMIYKILPDTPIAWNDVLIGAVATALLFAFGRFLIGLYLVYSSYTSVYGAAGSLVVVLMWVYYSAQIFYFGAEFTKVFAGKRGERTSTQQPHEPVTQGPAVE